MGGTEAAPSLQVCPTASAPCPSQEFVWQASHYLVRQVFNSLQEMFSSTRAIQVCPPPPPSVTSQIGPTLSLFHPSALADRECPAHCSIRLGCGVDHPSGHSHHSALPSRLQSIGMYGPHPHLHPRCQGRPHAPFSFHPNPTDWRRDPESHLLQQWGHQPVSAQEGVAGLRDSWVRTEGVLTRI